jgi:signal peptidase I
MTTATAAALGAAIIAMIAVTVLTLRHRYTVITVRGPSMTPTLREGEKVLARRVRGQAVRNGDIIILRVPGTGADGTPNRYTAVKRVAATAGDPLPAFLPPRATTSSELLPTGHLAVLSDNPKGSVDSRAWGLVPAANVLAKVVRKLLTLPARPGGLGRHPAGLLLTRSLS